MRRSTIDRARPPAGGAWLGAPRPSGPGAWREIAVIRALRGLGDMLCVVPALRHLRAGAPDARITCIGVPAGRWLLDRFPELLDDWIDLPSWPTIPEADGDPHDTVRLLSTRGGTFDLVCQLQGSGGPINRLARLLSRGSVAAHVPADAAPEQAPHLTLGAPPDLAVYAKPWPSVGHEARRMGDLVRDLGFPDTGDQLEFPVRPEDVRRLPTALVAPTERPIAVVHPGASRGERRWSTDGFTAVASDLQRRGLRVVITGTTPETCTVGAVADGCEVVPWVLLDPPLGALAALLRSAAVLVANDTGVAHLGVAVDVPSVVVGTTGDLDRWGPADRRRHAVVQTTGRTPADVEAVDAAVDRLLAGLAGQRAGAGTLAG